jgi:hypothetical protein
MMVVVAINCNFWLASYVTRKFQKMQVFHIQEMHELISIEALKLIETTQLGSEWLKLLLSVMFYLGAKLVKSNESQGFALRLLIDVKVLRTCDVQKLERRLQDGSC